MLCGLLVIAAWHALAYGVPDRRALGAPLTALLVLTAAVAGRSTLVRSYTWLVLPLALAGALGGAGPAGPLRAARPALPCRPSCSLLGAQVGEVPPPPPWPTRLRLGHLDDYAPWGERQEVQAAAIAGADGWPRYRTDPGRAQTVGNDPLLVGGEGAQYYSSLTSDVLSRTLTALGGGWTSRGRACRAWTTPSRTSSSPSAPGYTPRPTRTRNTRPRAAAR
ncbi:hypothetical protein LT493_07035 [Streptomyces tricolor]|nr:hypothetical protein [Streptomyces tricolor]